ncbi:hypothetical protein OESDEN_24097, partial [Oesophagostomum dentatum]
MTCAPITKFFSTEPLISPQLHQDYCSFFSVSSVEDPITEAPRIRTPARTKTTKKESASPPTHTVISTVNADSTDYGFYIRI